MYSLREVIKTKIASPRCNQNSFGLVPSFMMDRKDKKQDNKPNYYDNRWYESNSFWDGIGCLLDLAFLGCMVPTVLFVVVVGFGAGVAKKPVQRFGTQMVARVQRMRQRPTKRVVSFAKPMLARSS